MRMIGRWLLFILAGLALLSCNDMGASPVQTEADVSVTAQPTAAGNDAAVVPANSDDTENPVMDVGTDLQFNGGTAGTNVGNPTPPRNLTVTIKTTERILSDLASSEASAQMTSTLSGDSSHDQVSSCRILESNVLPTVPFQVTPPRSQICRVTPQGFKLRVLAMWLNECADANGTPAICKLPLTGTRVEKRTEIFRSSGVDVEVTADGVVFPAELVSPLAPTEIGGFQMALAYVENRFPDEASDPEEASLVMPFLRGKAFRICTLPEDHTTAAYRLENCGNAEVHFGDLLVDADDDGTFGFIDITALQPDVVVETTVRPEKYLSFQDGGIQKHLQSFINIGMQGKTDASYFSVDGVYAPTFPAESITHYLPETGKGVTVNFNIRSVQFVDGARYEMKLRNGLCVSALSSEPCDPDDDPASVGIYNPYYDGMFVPRPPVAVIE